MVLPTRKILSPGTPEAIRFWSADSVVVKNRSLTLSVEAGLDFTAALAGLVPVAVPPATAAFGHIILCLARRNAYKQTVYSHPAGDLATCGDKLAAHR